MKHVYFLDASTLHDPLMLLVSPTGITLVQIESNQCKEAKAYTKICYKFTLC